MARMKKSEAASAAPAASETTTVQTPAKRSSAKKVKELYLQTGGKEWNITDCKDRAAAAYVAEGHKASSIKKLVVYLKPDEGKAYYVVNDSENGSFDL